MVLVSNGETFAPGASGVTVTNRLGIFRKKMDSLLLGGRDIVIDLSPIKTPCASSTCKFNPIYNKFVGVNQAICQACKGRGFTFEQRQVQYKCNRRWTNEPFDRPLVGRQNNEGGRIYGNFVRTKTHIASFNFISQSLGATIDGLKVKLFQEPRKTGWNNEIFYVIAWWQRTNKKENG